MLDELEGNMLGRRGMGSQRIKYRQSLCHVGLTIGDAQHGLRPRLMAVGIEAELPTSREVLGVVIDAPACQNLGQTDDIRLCVAAKGPEGVKLEGLPPKIFIV